MRIEAIPLDVSGSVVSGKTVSWRSSDQGVASVDASGNVTALAVGTATITAEADGKTAALASTVLAFGTIQPGMLKTCALTLAGRLYCAGLESGGLAKPEGDFLRFAALTSHSEPQGSTVAHYCALTADGTAYCWGSNGFGQLGVGDLNARVTPTAVLGGMKFQSISAGMHHTCAITAAGDAYCWGEGTTGQLGTGNNLSSAQPVGVAGAPRFVQIESGHLHACGLTSDGQAWCWGRNHLAQLGRGSTSSSVNLPAIVAGGVRFRSLGSKWTWTCGITALGKSYCWGDSTLGQLGFETSVSCDGGKPCAQEPEAVATSLTFTSVAASQFSTCAVTVDKQVYCWGGNFQDQFGTRSPVAQCPIPGFVSFCTPVPTPGPAGFTKLRSSPRNYCGIATDGIAYCWGGNEMRQIGNPSVSGSTAVPVVFSIDPLSAP